MAERRASKARLEAERKRTGKKFSKTPPKKIQRGKSFSQKAVNKVVVRSKPGSARTVLGGATTRRRVKKGGG